MAIKNYYIERIANDIREKLNEEGIIENDEREKSINAKDGLKIFIEKIKEIIELFDGKLELRKKDDENEEQYPYIEKTSETNFVIYYADENNYMAILHELAHAFLHFENMNIDEQVSFYGHSESDLEAQLLARAIAMPRTEFEKVVIQNTTDCRCNVKSVADVYGISYLDVIARGKDLNIWK